MTMNQGIRHETVFTAVLLAASTVAAFSNDYYMYIFTLATVFAILTVSFDVLLGYTGYISMAHGALFGVGAYTLSYLMVREGWSFWLALLAAGVMAGLCGVLVGAISFRTKGLYFAVLTLGIGLIGQQAFFLVEGITGGIAGIAGMFPPTIGSLGDKHVMLILAVVILWITYVLARWFVRSRLGAASLAVREDLVLAQTLGIRVGLARLSAFAFSSFFAGIAGALYACLFGYISPEAFGVLNLGFHSVVQVVVGGMGTLWGPAIGTFVMVALPELVRSAAQYSLLFYGVIMLLVIRFAPNGIAGLAINFKRKTGRRKATPEPAGKGA